MFYNCSSLISLPNISKWNTSNIINMEYLFYNCSSLTKLPDISNWKTDNLKNMDNIFYGCDSLILLPDISKWNTNKVKNQEDIFSLSSSSISNESNYLSSYESLVISYNPSSDITKENNNNNQNYIDFSNDSFGNNNELKEYYEHFYD